MKNIFGFFLKDPVYNFSILFVLSLGLVVIGSVAKDLFPDYFIYVAFAIVAYWIFSQFDFDILALFSKHFYVLSIILLVATLVIGSVTRGTIRWIPLGAISLQPAEIVRPFLLIFFAVYLTGSKMTSRRLINSILLLILPAVLILVQPSLGVSLLTVVGFFGVLIASNFDKKHIFTFLGLSLLAAPLFWFVMAPYQKQRITTFINPQEDPLGAGYNSIQSTITTGSGKLFGKGLGRGVQTQLSFLPEKQTDFIFASVAEELGFVGAVILLAASFVIMFRIASFMESSQSPAARGYLSGFLLTFLVQILIHAGMNMGIVPVTGLPYPLVSAGGSSLASTMIGLGIALGAYRKHA